MAASAPIEASVAEVVEIADAADVADAAAGVAAGATSRFQVQMSWTGDAKVPVVAGHIVRVEAAFDRPVRSTWTGR